MTTEKNPLFELEINGGDYNIRGNITLLSEIDGQKINWSSSDEDVISTVDKPIEDEEAKKLPAYEKIPKGVVKRGDEDITVILTATCGIYKKEFKLNVLKVPEKKTFERYIYAYFREPLVDGYHQQVFYAASEDGLHWRDLNYSRPVVKSTMGTKGLRDHFILRSYEGDRFFLICTDLELNEFRISDIGHNWSYFGCEASKYLMIWESTDLINWGEQRMCKVSNENQGCSWAPECSYDTVTGEYVIYYSGQSYDKNDPSNYDRKVVFYVKTRDFRTFTEPKKFADIFNYEDKEAVDAHWRRCGVIDTTMIKTDNWYYRITKNELTSGVTADRSKYVLGEYERVESNLRDKTFLRTEGPAIFKFCDRDEWCLMLDGISEERHGWFPSVTSDLDRDYVAFTELKEGYKMPTGPKHGVMFAVTKEEYYRVTEHFGISSILDLEYTDNAKIYEKYDMSNLRRFGTLSKDDAEDAIYVKSGYLEIDLPKNEDGTLKEDFTVSFDLFLDEKAGVQYPVIFTEKKRRRCGEGFTGVRINNGYYSLISVENAFVPGEGHEGEEFEAPILETYTERICGDGWIHIDYVIKGDRVSLYENGEHVESQSVFVAIVIDATVMRFGYSPILTDRFMPGRYKNIVIYDGALSEKCIKELNK